MNKFSKHIFLASLLFSVSCQYFKKEETKTPIARVNDTYLYKEDLEGLTFENTSKEDSTLIVNNFVTRWATRQLLLDQAQINLSEKNQEDFDRMVSEYKNELYTESYKNTIVARDLDSTVSEREYDQFYETNKQNFILNDVLLKVRYVNVDKEYSQLQSIKQKIDRFNPEDKADLTAQSIQFKSFNLNDSTWIKRGSLLNSLPLLRENEASLNNPGFFQLQDSLGVYLVKIKEVLKPKDIAPLSYVKPTIKQIILNKRKLDLIKKLEKDITKDALTNKQFEIYEGN